nr:glycosyltransferase family 4 protein [Pararhodobacter sp. SW119]
MLELGIDGLPPERPAREGPGLRLLHVGRAVRTKGLRDVIRALAQLSDLPDVTLTAIGDGEDLPHARAEAVALGVADRVTFRGRQPKEVVMEAYAEADVFAFPSFREPTGGVLYEAMQAGLPVITVDYGGPAFITDDACAIRLQLSTPEALARDLAAAIRTLYHDPERRSAMGQAARTRVAVEGLWPRKIDRLLRHYDEVLRQEQDKKRQGDD